MVTGEEKTSILIIDDEVGIRTALLRKFTSEGYLCDESGNAGEALEKLRTRPIDLVILDIRMPGRSGNELLIDIKQDYPDTAVIMSTAIADTDIIIECMREGANDYIVKPFDLSEITLSVKKALRTRELELKVKEYQQQLEQKVEEQTREIRSIFLGAIESLVVALEAKDGYTAGHSRRVTEMVLKLGQILGLSDDEMEDLRWGALLHDIGKIAIDPAIQNKVTKLTPAEYNSIMAHAREGSRIVKPLTNKTVVDMIAHHHDHFDGEGFHQDVTGEQIPLGARIIAVADTFDAMTSDRPYRVAMSAEESVAEIEQCAGTQLDPVVVKALLEITGLQQSLSGSTLTPSA
ncbi:MAG TPA: response regulator [Dehalococcoidia bacterium]|nr:response regulator [Dehalococcoidia bacterium]